MNKEMFMSAHSWIKDLSYKTHVERLDKKYLTFQGTVADAIDSMGFTEVVVNHGLTEEVIDDIRLFVTLREEETNRE